MEQNELIHYGIRGMKWGIRRYQNKDGSLTPAGRKRARERETGDDKSASKTTETSAPKKKSVSEMSDDELRQTVNRIRLEREYSSLTPKEVSRGKALASKFLNEAIQPALVSATKQVLTDYLTKSARDALGLNEKSKDSTEALKKEVTKLSLKKQKNELDKYFKAQEEEKNKE